MAGLGLFGLLEASGLTCLFPTLARRTDYGGTGAGSLVLSK
jgi:hypothetical protein